MLPLIVAIGLTATFLPVQDGSERAALPQLEDTQEAKAAADEDRTPDDAIEAVRNGDYGLARKILGSLLVEQKLASGRALMAEGNPLDALLPLDEAVALAPKDPQVLFTRGTAFFETASSDPAQHGLFFDDAMRDFEGAIHNGGGIEAVFCASRAARLKPDEKKALEYALRGASYLDQSSEERPSFNYPPERVIAEASFDSYRVKLGAEEDGAELFMITEDYLGRLAGRTPEDSWPSQQLSLLYQWQGDMERAAQLARRGLELAPENAALHQRFADMTRKVSGRAGVLAAYEDFNVVHGADLALGIWYPAVEMLYLAIDTYNAEEDASELYAQAELKFQECRELQPNYEQSCRGYEVICRAGVGWSQLRAENLDAATATFKSMEDVIESGLAWSMGDRVRSGVLGLQYIVGAYNHDSEDTQAIVHAAQISDYLHAYQPKDAALANNAGFFNRDAAVLVIRDARSERTAALSSAANDADRAAAATAYKQKYDEAYGMMERSYAAYETVAKMEPEGVRTVNDTALIMTYYLRTDAAAAERYLLQSVEAGFPQVAEAKAALEAATDEEERKDLTEDLDTLLEAWGDAHQNLGVLYLSMTGEPAKAKGWFEKSLEIGPVPRHPVRDHWIPACDKAVAGETDYLDLVRAYIWLDEK